MSKLTNAIAFTILLCCVAVSAPVPRPKDKPQPKRELSYKHYVGSWDLHWGGSLYYLTVYADGVYLCVGPPPLFTTRGRLLDEEDGSIKFVDMEIEDRQGNWDECNIVFPVRKERDRLVCHGITVAFIPQKQKEF